MGKIPERPEARLGIEGRFKSLKKLFYSSVVGGLPLLSQWLVTQFGGRKRQFVKEFESTRKNSGILSQRQVAIRSRPERFLSSFN